MVLNDEQCNRFFDTMDALLLYVNDRFRVVEDFTLDYTGQIGDLKTALVAQTLWDNVEIIDEFVRANPFHLPRRCLDTALAWKVALPGLYTLVRYQGGRALMMSERGVFSVCGVTNEIEDEAGTAPAYVDIVLLPFDDVIVYDGFLQAYDVEGSHDEATRIQDEFENRCAQGIISTAAEFTTSVGAYLAEKRDDDLEALLADIAREAAGEQEELPAGFHRGALAGLEELEREQAIMDELLGHERELDAGGMFDLFNEVPANESAAGQRMSTENVPQQSAPGTGADAENAFPHLAPPQPDAPRPLSRTRNEIQQDQAVNCAISCVLLRGIVELGEAYEEYRALVPDPLAREDFESLVRYEASFSDAYFGLWEHESRTYLQYYTLTPDYITQMASRAGDWRGLKDELAYYESYKSGLVETRTETPPRPLSRTLLENTPLGELLGNSNVMRLRRFLDERIPDGQDDYTFADLAVQEFVLTSVESGNPDELFRLRDDLGLAGCTTDIDRFDRLMLNAFNAMPSWENNGWSPQELYEQLTGRKVFFNEDGTPMRIAPDDPCPCGSGEPYRSCCGR